MANNTGAYGIKRVEYSDRAITCGECFRSWVEDITPAGRCPWEDRHSKDLHSHTATRKRKAITGGLWG